MMKKIAALIGAGAMLLSVATPAFAGGWSFTINKAKVKTTSIVTANTGWNMVGNSATVKKAGVDGEVEVGGNNTVRTGDASARNLGVVAANTTVGCGACGGGGFTVNKAKVKTETLVGADTGNNWVGNSATVKKAGVDGDVEVGGNNNVSTGDASARNIGVVLVNTQVSFGP